MSETLASAASSLATDNLPSLLPPLRLPVGYDIFSTVIELGLDFIDKTLFVKEVFEDPSAVVLITRPRRFGKTLTLSMLHHFLAAEIISRPTHELFKGFKITEVDGGKYMERQGKYPVIFVTFKGVKDLSFTAVYAAMRQLMSSLYEEHYYLLESPKLTQNNKDFLNTIMDGKAEQAQIKVALRELSGFLLKHHGVKPWLLIDEYDTPIQASYTCGYYDEMISFMREMFGAALKTNPYVQKTVLTGILRVSKESLFSDLNNISVYTTLHKKYSQYFGFTEDEVNYMLQRNNLAAQADEVKGWYNGYQFGNTIVYNPWSIVKYLDSQGDLQPYWINTSSNELVRNLLIKSPLTFKRALEDLLNNIPLQTTVDENVTFGDLGRSESAVWSLMLASGYLKATAVMRNENGLNATLCIPNYEVTTLYRQMIKQWLSYDCNVLWYNRFLEYLLSGNVAEFANYLKTVVMQIVSVHDVAHEPEAFYQGLMLGFAASINKDQYEVLSNKESGYGRYDVAIIPKNAASFVSQTVAAAFSPDCPAVSTSNCVVVSSANHPAASSTNRPAIILELKSVASLNELERAAAAALAQIAAREYVSAIHARGITNIVKIGIAFCGKDLVVKSDAPHFELQ